MMSKLEKNEPIFENRLLQLVTTCCVICIKSIADKNKIKYHELASKICEQIMILENTIN